jgi:predicted nucleic acid-binding Zn ribbon protein
MTWKPLPRSPADQPVKSLRNSLDQLAGRLGAPPADLVSVVFSKWSEVVGDEIAAHAQPESLTHGTLTVEVGDARWATQLKWLGPKLVKRLNEEAGREIIKAFEVHLKPRSSPK